MDDKSKVGVSNFNKFLKKRLSRGLFVVISCRPTACNFTKKWTPSLFRDSKINTWKQLFTGALKITNVKDSWKVITVKTYFALNKFVESLAVTVFVIFGIALIYSWLHKLNILTILDLGVFGILRILIKKYTKQRLDNWRNRKIRKTRNLGKYL